MELIVTGCKDVKVVDRCCWSVVEGKVVQLKTRADTDKRGGARALAMTEPHYLSPARVTSYCSQLTDLLLPHNQEQLRTGARDHRRNKFAPYLQEYQTCRLAAALPQPHLKRVTGRIFG